MKTILHPAVAQFKENYLKNPSMVVTPEPISKKKEVLSYLKNRIEPGVIGAFYCKDPITGKIVSDGNAVYEADGFVWSTEMIHLFERYNAKLSEDFLTMFDH